MNIVKCQIKQIAFLLIIVALAFSVINGCASVSKVEDPFERWVYDENGEDKTKKLKNISDMHILAYTSGVKRALSGEAKSLRYIRKSSSTIGVIAGAIATTIHGAFKADADTITMFSGVSTLTPLLQKIWGAGEASQAKQNGIGLVFGAQSRYFEAINEPGYDGNKGEPNNKKVTLEGATLFKEVNAALKVVGDAIAQRIPSFEDMKAATGELEEKFAMKVVPSKVGMRDVGVGTSTAYITIINDRAINASSDNHNVAVINPEDRKDFVRRKLLDVVRIDSVGTGTATVNIFNLRGEVAAVKVKVGNHLPVANAGSYAPVVKGGLVKLDGRASFDPDGDQLKKYTWSFSKRPPNSKAEFSNINSETPNFKADVAGEYKVTLVVNDGTDNSVPNTVRITAKEPAEGEPAAEAEPAAEEEPVAVEPTYEKEINLSFVPLDSLAPNDPKRKRFRHLTFMGGIKMHAEDSNSKSDFGGLSGLALLPQDKIANERVFNIIAISDKGYWFKAKLTEDPNGKLTGLEDYLYTKMLDTDGKADTAKDKMNAESITISPEGQIIVSFERTDSKASSNRLWSYSYNNNSFSKASKYFIPSEEWNDFTPGKDWKFDNNKGIEAATFFDDDNLVMISETDVSIDDSTGNYFPGWILEDGKVVRKILLGKTSLRPTGLAEMPNGEIIILEHEVHDEVDENGKKKNSVRISKLVPTGKNVKDASIFERNVLNEFSKVSYLDNFEAITARVDNNGSTVIYILSDNNMKDSSVQENVLLKFKVEFP